MPDCNALLLLTTALCFIEHGDPDGLVHYEEFRECILFVTRKIAQYDLVALPTILLHCSSVG